MATRGNSGRTLGASGGSLQSAKCAPEKALGVMSSMSQTAHGLPLKRMLILPALPLWSHICWPS